MKNNDYPRLREMRLANKLTQEQVGKILNTTQQQYWYEKGIQEIPVHHLLTLAEYYYTSVDYLLGKTNVRILIDH